MKLLMNMLFIALLISSGAATSADDSIIVPLQGPPGIQGPAGPVGPRGATGPQGPAGPATKTVAVCANASTTDSSYCSCSGGKVISKTIASGPTGSCSITSETGVCSARGASNGTDNYAGSCCVCSPS